MSIKSFPKGINLDKSLILSYSSLGTLNTCPRKYELTKIHPMSDVKDDKTAALVQGTAVGMGVGKWLETRDLDRAILEAWMNYWPVLEDTVRDQTKACRIVEVLSQTRLLRGGRYTVAIIHGKPAIETSFCIKLAPAIYYVGFLDAILLDHNNGSLLPLELKTTTVVNHIECIYKNSAQGNGYGLILDKIAQGLDPNYVLGQTYDIQYLVAQAHKAKADQYNPTIHEFRFTKTIVDRLEWLMEIKQQLNRIRMYLDTGLFPKNGSSCRAWNRPCHLYGLCSLSGKDKLFTEDKEHWEDTDRFKEYDFYFDMETLTEDALKLSEEVV